MQGAKAELASEAEEAAQKLIEAARGEAERAGEAAQQERAAAEEAAKAASEAIEHWKGRAQQSEGAVKALERDVRAVIKVSPSASALPCTIGDAAAALIYRALVATSR